MDICVYTEPYPEELARVIVEAEKSHNLLCVSWRPRKAGGEA